MKDEQKRNYILGGVALVAILVAGYFYLSGGEDTAPPTAPGAIYYTGPMKSKNPAAKDMYGNPDGTRVDPAAAKAEIDRWQQEHLTKK